MTKFKPGKAMTAFVLFFFPILLALGTWQVNRGYEKQETLEVLNFQKSLPAIDEIKILGMDNKGAIYRTVFLEGQFGKETYFLDNRLYRQEAGYEVFTTFRTVEENLYLVNKGWISKDKVGSIKESGADVVATANPGCFMQLENGIKEAGLDVEVMYVTDLLDASYADK